MKLREASFGFKAVLSAVLAILVLAGAGCSDRQGRDEKSAAVPVRTVKAASGRLSRGDILTGKVAAEVEVNLAPKIPGKVGAVMVDVGQEVKAGQVVLRLDAPEIEAAVRQAEAAVRVAEAGMNQAALGVERAKAALEQAQENHRLAEANYNRGKLLLEQEAISDADFEARFEQPYINAAGALKTAEAAYRQAVDQKENLAPAQLEQARAALTVAQTNYANTVVTAPVGGTVTARNVDPGELASPQVPAVTIVKIDTVVIEAGASDRQVNKLKVGQEAKVDVDAVRNTPFAGRITSISPATDQRAKNYVVKVAVGNPGHLLKPGMFAEVEAGIASEGILVPCDAVSKKGYTTVVFIVKSNKAVLREVEIGESDGRSSIVKRGLSPGDLVVVTGQDRLDDGTPVMILNN